MDVIQQHYDAVPYHAWAHPSSHPSRLAAAVRLAGFSPPDVRRARILEIGCASGLNLMGIAQALPEAHGLGIDLSPVQISQAQQDLREVSLPNLEFRCQDIRDFPIDPAGFDYIIAHGIFSWVPQDVQIALLEICRHNLRPNGVAYIGYSTLPGCTQQNALRELMLMTFGQGPLAERAAQTSRLLNSLSNVWKLNECGAAWLASAQAILNTPEDIRHHDQFGPICDPCYFRDFVHRAADHGLLYVADAHEPLGSLAILPAEIRKSFDDLKLSPLEQEQAADFARVRRHRCSVLVRQDSAPELHPVNCIDQLILGTDLKPTANPSGGLPTEFITTTTKLPIRILDPLISAFIVEIVAHSRAMVPFSQAAGRAVARLRGSADPAALEYLRGIAHNLLGAGLLSVGTVNFLPSADLPPERPILLPLNRLRARRNKSMLTPLLQEVPLANAPAAFFSRLDGSVTVQEAASAAGLPEADARSILAFFWRRGLFRTS